MRPIILASGSPRRKELLAAEGYDFTVLTSSADESFDEGLAPIEVAPLLARIKAQAVAGTLEPADPSPILIGADTIVALGNVIYGKPTDEEDAKRMLAELSGNTHQVITGVCLICGDRVESFATVTDVTFRSLEAAEIDAYVATGEPSDKAGAYGIQGLGGALVDHTDGSFNNVVGLPTEDLKPRLDALLNS